MSVHIRHNTNDISTDTGAKPSVGGVAFNSMMPVVGSSNGAAMSVTTAAATATFTANEIVVKSALGGNVYILPSYSQAINLATTGAGGMDTGTAPVSGYVALYAIYNPTTPATSILATNATSAAAPEIYGGANMPAGYTASALISVWPTNASSQFVVGTQIGREIARSSVQVLNTSTQQASLTLLSIASAVPFNAKKAIMTGSIVSTSNSNNLLVVAGTSAGVGSSYIGMGGAAANQTIYSTFSPIPVSPAQTVYYTATASAGTMTTTMNVSGYSI